MTTATADLRHTLTALDTEHADYSRQLSHTLTRLDVLRREARESGPNAAIAAKVRELEADETRLRGTLAQVAGDIKALSDTLISAEMDEETEADLSRIRQALAVDSEAEQVHAARIAALAAIDPHLLATVQIIEKQRTAHGMAKNALLSIAKRYGLLQPDSLPGHEQDAALDRLLGALGLSSDLIAPVMRPDLPLLVWPVLPLEAE